MREERVGGHSGDQPERVRDWVQDAVEVRFYEREKSRPVFRGWLSNIGSQKGKVKTASCCCRCRCGNVEPFFSVADSVVDGSEDGVDGVGFALKAVGHHLGCCSEEVEII